MKTAVHFAPVTFRPERPCSVPETLLGLVLEFVVDGTWAVAYAGRAVITQEELQSIDLLSRQLIEGRSGVMKAEVERALVNAVSPGDVVRALAVSNPLSIHVGLPQRKEVPIPTDQARSTEQFAEHFALIAYTNALDGRGFEERVPVDAEKRPRIAHRRLPMVEETAEPMKWLSVPTTFIRSRRVAA
jgi:hypothetical protein